MGDEDSDWLESNAGQEWMRSMSMAAGKASEGFKKVAVAATAFQTSARDLLFEARSVEPGSFCVAQVEGLLARAKKAR